eukprot:CAMPEP_0196725214 /NCGR_PEP_ID=MMETSP1091-20130531/6841_1 /TAXON_ID=302021 /ORGANISM="Rhodomonas sp., Strain CCMP768" /LENGTH=106 /DNA_ID=CAMNT_0042067457 /DNA_START=57 /DNA_END=373 /DNA_ORIENTATION=+
MSVGLHHGSSDVEIVAAPTRRSNPHFWKTRAASSSRKTNSATSARTARCIAIRSHTGRSPSAVIGVWSRLLARPHISLMRRAVAFMSSARDATVCVTLTTTSRSPP